MLSPLKVATPPTAATVFVPDRTAPLVPVLEVIAKVTLAVELAVLPLASWIVTTGCVAKAKPAAAPAG